MLKNTSRHRSSERAVACALAATVRRRIGACGGDHRQRLSGWFLVLDRGVELLTDQAQPR